MISTRIRAAALAGSSALILTGCLMTPGKFASELQLMKDGSFAYAYDGEIQMLALGKLAELANTTDETFAAECWNDDFEERECTATEVAEQKKDWEANAAERKEKSAKEAEQMKVLFGGIDPSSPEAAKELAERLQRQRGWNAVVYKGDGLFDVDFAISGQLSHDFAFPTIEKLPMANVFVSVNLRNEKQVRIDAPGFAAMGGGNPMQGMMSGAAGVASVATQGDGAMPKFATPDGTFTIVTDGRILANNTDEGPRADPKGQRLSWTITARTEQAPTALVAFD